MRHKARLLSLTLDRPRDRYHASCAFLRRRRSRSNRRAYMELQADRELQSYTGEVHPAPRLILSATAAATCSSVHSGCRVRKYPASRRRAVRFKSNTAASRCHGLSPRMTSTVASSGTSIRVSSIAAMPNNTTAAASKGSTPPRGIISLPTESSLRTRASSSRPAAAAGTCRFCRPESARVRPA